jgi:hypothetical protein
MKPFINRESYKHKCAKDIFKNWCNSTLWSSYGRSRVETNLGGCITWVSNRSENAWLEYPIVVNSDLDSIYNNWDEIWPNFDFEGGDDRYWNNFVPTYDECIKLNLIPTSIIDIVLTHKGIPRYFIEICHKNPVSDEKVKKLKQLGLTNLIEIDADWILNQIDIQTYIT